MQFLFAMGETFLLFCLNLKFQIFETYSNIEVTCFFHRKITCSSACFRLFRCGLVVVVFEVSSGIVQAIVLVKTDVEISIYRFSSCESGDIMYLIR